MNSSFSFAFDTLQLLGKFLSVQDLVNGETIKKSLSSIYGGYKATEIAMYSVIPMFIEAGLIIRPKQGLYQKNEEVIVNSEVVNKIFTASSLLVPMNDINFSATLSSFSVISSASVKKQTKTMYRWVNWKHL